MEAIFNDCTKVRITDKEVKKLISSSLVPNKEVLKTIQDGKEDELSTCFTNMVDNAFEYAMSNPTQLMETTKGVVFGAYNAILSGTGMQCINNSTFKYQPGHLFLLTPEDCHSFDIHTTSQMFFLQFNAIYIQNKSLVEENVKRLEYILQNANHQPGCIFRFKADKLLVNPIIEAIIREHESKDLYNPELIHQLVNTLIIIVARNIAKYLPQIVDVSTEEKALDILQYIQHNIYFPEKLKAGSVSAHFGISHFYLGRYFKKHTNETMQGYIGKYKTKLIQHRLKFSDKRLNEIADELGFVDVSHLNKFFIQQTSITPTAYRSGVH